MQYFVEFYRKYVFKLQKSSLWGMGPKNWFWANWGQKTYKQSHKCRTLYTIFANKASFYAEF